MPNIRDQDLNVPEVDPIDTPFKGRLALAVAIIALFGSLLGYAASRAGTQEEEAAREAQRNAILAMSEQSTALANYYDYIGGFATVTAFKQRQEIAEARANLLSIPVESVNSDRWRRAQDTLTDLSPLLQKGSNLQNSTLAWANSTVKPTLARLHQQSSRQEAADWGYKANVYVGGITLLAIALALLGLSATIAPRTRPFFWWPAAGITIATLAGFVIVILTPVPHISESAMRSVAEGDRLAVLGEFEKAMDSYTHAIQENNKYAVAYQKRADARALAESPEQGSLYVVSVIDPKARKENIADLDRAMEFGDKSLPILTNQGANYFHVRDYKKFEKLTRQALALNEDLPIPRANLALALSAQERTKEAKKEYQRAAAIFEKRSLLERHQLYASARTELETLLIQQPGLIDSVRQLQGNLVETQAVAINPGARIPAGRASIPRLGLNLDGPHIKVSMDYQNIPQNALVSKIFYFRPNGDAPWLQRHDLNTFERFKLVTDGAAHWDELVELQCPSAGDYRVDVYVNDRMLATARTARQSKLTELRTQYDPVGNYILCQPSTWKYSTNSAGHISIESPDGEQRLSIQAVPLTLPVERGEKLSDAALERLGRPFQAKAVQTDPVAQFIVGGVHGNLKRYVMEDGREALVWVSIHDGMLRTLLFEYHGGRDYKLIDDLVKRVKFNPRITE